MADDSIAPSCTTRKEAIALGLKRFYTGRPCKHGHISERDVSSGTCIRCRDDRSKAWYWSDRERSHANRNRWRAQNRERDLAAKRAYASRNQEKLKAKNKAYWLSKRDKYLAWGKEWKRNHPIHSVVYTQNRRARLAGYPGKGITVAHYTEMTKEQNGRCAYCGEQAKLSLDHVWAVARGGGHEPQNCVLACRGCNIRKQHAQLDEFLRSLAVSRPGQWTATLADIARLLAKPWRHEPYEVSRTKPGSTGIRSGVRIGSRARAEK